jgi:hypothetical protein
MKIETLTKLLPVELNLVDHTEYLLEANETLKLLIIKFEELKESNQLCNFWHDKLYEDNSKILAYVGDLSKQIFNIESQIEEIYTKHYILTPIEAKHYWYYHYRLLHKPYSLIKNRCWKLFDNLDVEYKKCNNNNNPPNWDNRLYNNIITATTTKPDAVDIYQSDKIKDQFLYIDNNNTPTLNVHIQTPLNVLNTPTKHSKYIKKKNITPVDSIPIDTNIDDNYIEDFIDDVVNDSVDNNYLII